MAGDIEIIERHLAHLEHLGHRPGTILAKRWCLLRARRAVGGDLMAADRAAVYAFVSNPEWCAETRCGAVSHVRGFFRWCLEHDLIETDPTVGLERPRRPRHLPRPMPEPDLARALRAANEPIRAWLYLAAFAGLRCCEIAPLRGEDRAGAVLVIREQKGGDEGSVPIGPVLAIAIGHLPARGAWFPRWDGVPGSISAGQLQRHANRFLHELGIAHTMHTLRHRYISRVYEASGRDLRLTQDLARHRSIISTVGYTWIDPAAGAAVVALLA